jgi:hypothetical protein
MHLAHSVRSSPEAEVTRAHSLPLIQSRPDRAHCTQPRNRRPRQIQRRPPIQQRIHRLATIHTHLHTLILKRAARERLRLLHERVVGRDHGEERERDDAGEDEGGSYVELEG